MIRLSIKKSLFPGQRVAKIDASQAAAFFFFHFFFFVGKYCPFLGKKINFWKNEKKSPVTPF